MFKSILVYDISSKNYNLETLYYNDLNIGFYQIYNKFNNIRVDCDIMLLMQEQAKYEKIDCSYYQGFIDNLYKE
jgi:hypothetical protein